MGIQMTTKFKLSILTSGIILLGFLRFYVFYNTNWILKTLTEGRRNAARHEFYFLLEWQPSSIVTLKWLLTVLFSSLFIGLTSLIIHMAFKSKENNRIVLIAYGILILVAAILFGLGKVFGFSQDIYGVVRTIMGIVQSFLPLMIFYILFKFLAPVKEQ